ncbi:MAG: hypothetical protein A3K19_33220 [Lentisphaerae bacterium RIFOXYB12_FULL_65_16]|nr:MAG: hypothetical protein A3K18_02360 [Lentisphaerae bacterium RIFOXYA12_64_32]OGV86996.1 MAG: hypothetical protein A3K19_33220 [Lentisphaerae bacterium RIFOXYB12_FULL_65_16]
MLFSDLHEAFSSYSLTVIPLFVLMGQISFDSGISRRLFATAYCWLGALPGGLAMATVGACSAFGAICGSGPATTATMASRHTQATLYLLHVIPEPEAQFWKTISTRSRASTPRRATI